MRARTFPEPTESRILTGCPLHARQTEYFFLVFSALIAIFVDSLGAPELTHHTPVTQLVEHWVVMREIVSPALAGPTIRVFK